MQNSWKIRVLHFCFTFRIPIIILFRYFAFFFFLSGFTGVLTASFKALPGRNLGTREAGIVIFSPV